MSSSSIRGTQRILSENICSEDDLRSKIFGTFVVKGWRMVHQKLWVSKNFSRISRVSQSRFLSGYVRLAVSFFIRRCLGVSIFCNVEGSRSPDSLVCIFLK